MNEIYCWKKLGPGDYGILKGDKVVARSGDSKLIEGICKDLNDITARQGERNERM